MIDQKNTFFQTMDVKTKLTLMKHTDSYWTLLPPEVKELILTYKESQERIEWRESEESCFVSTNHLVSTIALPLVQRSHTMSVRTHEG